MDLREVRCDAGDWIDLAQEWQYYIIINIRSRVPVSLVMGVEY